MVISQGAVSSFPSNQSPMKYPISGPKSRTNGIAVRNPIGRNHRPVFSGESNFNSRPHTVLGADCDFVNHFAISAQNEQRIWNGKRS